VVLGRAAGRRRDPLRASRLLAGHDGGGHVDRSTELEQVEIIQEFEIPPPPEQIQRPAVP
jgi:hypothetical protein